MLEKQMFFIKDEQGHQVYKLAYIYMINVLYAQN